MPRLIQPAYTSKLRHQRGRTPLPVRRSLTTGLTSCQRLAKVTYSSATACCKGRLRMEEKTQRRRSSGTSGQTHERHARTRAPARPGRRFFSYGSEMYGYLALGLALCMFIYFFGNPTSWKLPSDQTSSSTVFPQQIPPSSLSPQQPPNHPILEPAPKAQEPAKMSNVERT